MSMKILVPATVSLNRFLTCIFEAGAQPVVQSDSNSNSISRIQERFRSSGFKVPNGELPSRGPL